MRLIAHRPLIGIVRPLTQVALGLAFGVLGSVALVQAQPAPERTNSGAAASADGSVPACTCDGECAQVEVTRDNYTDLNCSRELVGQTLRDADADGIPDVCDTCPRTPNPLSPVTGRAGACDPEPACPAADLPPTATSASSSTPVPATASASVSGSSTNATTNPVETSPPRVQCVNGKVVNLDEHSVVWFAQPRVFAFTPFKQSGSSFGEGVHVYFLTNLSNRSCTTDDFGGVPTIIYGLPRWTLRGGLFGGGSVDFENVRPKASVALNFSVSYHPSSSWSIGPALHTMTLWNTKDQLPALVGLGARLGVLDVLSLTPFAQADVAGDFELSYGMWLNFDLGALEDLGIALKR